MFHWSFGNRVSVLLALSCAFVVVATTPVSASVQFTLDSFTVTANTGDGLIIETAPANPGPLSFELVNVGDSKTFDLFHIWTTEEFAHPDDFVPQPISVEFSFSAPPPGFGGDSDGDTTTGANFGYFFLVFWQAFGEVAWDGPIVLPFSGDGLLQIALSDETFNDEGDWTIFPVTPEFAGQGATVNATFTLLAAPSAPEPTTLLVWGGLAMAAAVFGRRTRRTA